MSDIKDILNRIQKSVNYYVELHEVVDIQQFLDKKNENLWFLKTENRIWGLN